MGISLLIGTVITLIIVAVIKSGLLVFMRKRDEVKKERKRVVQHDSVEARKLRWIHEKLENRDLERLDLMIPIFNDVLEKENTKTKEEFLTQCVSRCYSDFLRNNLSYTNEELVWSPILDACPTSIQEMERMLEKAGLLDQFNRKVMLGLKKDIKMEK